MHNDFGKVKDVQYDPKNLSGVIEFEQPIARKVIKSIESEQLTFDGIKPKLKGPQRLIICSIFFEYRIDFNLILN